MAIKKNIFKVVPSNRLDDESMSSEDDELQKHGNNKLDKNDCDSGAGCDNFDLLELGETGEEICQIGDQTCSIPFELYDLHGLEHILSMDVWNDVLTDDERLNLAKYLPDIDEEHFMRTMKDLFTGCNFHFGVPMKTLFDMLKGGLCEPRVSLYHQGLRFFQKQRHYETIRQHQNNMVDNLVRIQYSWSKCRGYSIEEKLRVLNTVKSQRSLFYEKMEELGSDSSAESADGLWSNKKIKDHKLGQARYPGYRSRPTLAIEPANDRKQNPKGSQERTMTDMKTGRTVWIGRVVTDEELKELLAKPVETESDSSYQFGKDDDDDNNPLMRSKWAYPRGVKSRPNFKKPKFYGKNNNKNIKNLDGSFQISRKNNDLHDKEKSKTHGSNLFNVSNGDGQIEGMFSRKTYPCGKKQKGEFGNDHSTLPSMHINSHDMMDVRLLECNSGMKKRKVKDELKYMDDHDQESQGQGQSEANYPGYRSRPTLDIEPTNDRKQNPKGSKERTMYDVTLERDNNLTDRIGKKTDMKTGRTVWIGRVVTDEELKELLAKPVETELDEDFRNQTQKKPLITPTFHTGFSFSIVHLLSAVRMAMVTLLPEDNVNEVVNQDQGIITCEPNVNPNVPSLTVKDIVSRVSSNPGDPCILETQEPLQDLVRGVLKIFGSKTAPLGAKGWKPLVAYKKSVKSWSWVRPVSQISSGHEMVEEVTSPESWGLPHKMLVKLVDKFANWLKNGQETLKQIGSLPDPPLTLMQVNLDEKERFRDLRAQKSLNTINPSSDEIRDYFRKEEMIRYLIPDRIFAYTAIDGKKSTVAPSKKGAGKPTSKAREHFMLKRDRPPHVTILCLVRDAAARLPGSIGTRADVCTLIRDSQYIVDEVSDAQVNQVVSGALDRLHYERDPCVQFDGERKLWVYLHRDREEEDFEDDGTSSTKKWKRQKKEPVEPGGADTLAYHGTGESGEFDSGIEPSGINSELLCQKNESDHGFDDGRDDVVQELSVS